MEFERDGCAMIPSVIPQSDCEVIAGEIVVAMSDQPAGSIETTGGRVVGGRNLIDRWEGWKRVFQQPSVADLIASHVSSTAGLVRILYFDKPPGHSWSLSLHRDKTIAVAEHHSPALPFSRPTIKAGVPHVVATYELLRSMLTLRLHLDPMTHSNGPLVVVPGSHKNLETPIRETSQMVQCNAGDLFVMRPLLLHGSRASDPETVMHRRVVHFEIAASESLPRGYRWHRFERL